MSHGLNSNFTFVCQITFILKTNESTAPNWNIIERTLQSRAESNLRETTLTRGCGTADEKAKAEVLNITESTVEIFSMTVESGTFKLRGKILLNKVYCWFFFILV